MMEWSIWNGQILQNLSSFCFKTFLNACKARFCIAPTRKQSFLMKIERIMGPFHVLEIL